MESCHSKNLQRSCYIKNGLLVQSYITLKIITFVELLGVGWNAELRGTFASSRLSRLVLDAPLGITLWKSTSFFYHFFYLCLKRGKNMQKEEKSLKTAKKVFWPAFRFAHNQKVTIIHSVWRVCKFILRCKIGPWSQSFNDFYTLGWRKIKCQNCQFCHKEKGYLRKCVRKNIVLLL